MSFGKVLGRLASSEEIKAYYQDSYKEHFIPVHKGWLMIVPVSLLPQKISHVEEFGCDIRQLDDAFSYEEYSDSAYLDDAVYERVMNEYIIFDPHISQRNTCYNPEYFTITSEALRQCSKLKGVLYIDLDKSKISSFESFEKMLTKGSGFRLNCSVSTETDDHQNIIIVCRRSRKDEVEAYIYGGISAIEQDSSGVKIYVDDVDNIRKAPFDLLEAKDKIAVCEKYNLIFMSLDYELDCVNKVLAAYGEEEFESVAALSESHRNKFINYSNSPLSHSIKNEALVALRDSGTLKDTAARTQEVRKKNNAFLEAFNEISKDNGLFYAEKDVINFDLSVRSSKLVILSGISGTGKSQLVKSYVEAQNRINDGRYVLKMIPVKPSWTDDSDLLGYVDYKSMSYRQADTGLVSLLLEAEKNPEKQYIVCFDEMNLARVEHYFAQFISILEDKDIDRSLVLYDSSISEKIKEESHIPPRIQIKNNVVFVGTINVDESTMMLSDKLLDRANVIKLEMQSFKMMQNNMKSLTQSELTFLNEMKNKIQEQNPKLGIGYRIVRQMDEYLYLLSNERYDGYSREDAFDQLVVQRIISKLRGSEEQVGRLIGTIDGSGHLDHSEIESILNVNNAISSFTQVRAELENKAKELKAYGYTV